MSDDNRTYRLYTFIYGRHSGIPDCCIRFFLDEWDLHSLYVSKHHPYVRLIDGLMWGYVPCPRCVARRNHIRVVQCDLECGPRNDGRSCREAANAQAQQESMLMEGGR